MCHRKILFESRPRPVFVGIPFTKFVIVCKHTCFVNELVGYIEYLISCVRGGSCCGELYSVLDLLNEDLNRLIRVLCAFHGFVIVVEVSRRNVGIHGVEMIKDVSGHMVLISHVFISEEADIDLIHSNK